jgi:hypothetical protein
VSLEGWLDYASFAASLESSLVLYAKVDNQMELFMFRPQLLGMIDQELLQLFIMNNQLFIMINQKKLSKSSKKLRLSKRLSMRTRNHTTKMNTLKDKCL